ncbi:MAG: FAD-dependent oxidoreductase [Candidatus Bathyarchaeota archaeon]|nr:FAD-dependent oxidoreductase [Candidatus Bathyarchaeota archaeon]
MKKNRMSRRDFLKTAAAGAAAAGLAGTLSKSFLKDMFPPVKAERIPINSAIIVGAGFAGLNAAMLLTEMGKEVTVLEKCHRPGGRCQTHTYPNGQHSTISFSEWFSRQVDRPVWDLVEKFRLTEDVLTFDWDNFYYWRDEYHFDVWKDLIPQLPWDDEGGAQDFREFEDEVWFQGYICEPWEGTDYENYDYTDFKDWMLWNKQGKPHHRSDVEEFVNMNMKAEFGGPSNEVSAGEGISYWWYWDYSTFYQLRQGNYHFIEELCARIPPGALHLNEPVYSVENTANGVRAETKEGTYTADVAIVAVDHTQVPNLVPELPSERIAALQTMGATKNIRPIAQFTERYWETKYGFWSWGGYTDHDVPKGGICCFHETNPQPGTQGIMSMYVNEPESTELWKTRKGIHVSQGAVNKLTDFMLNEMDKFWPGAHDYVIDESRLAFEFQPYGPQFKPRYVLDGTYVLNRQPIGKIYFAGDYVYGFGASPALESAKDAANNFT